MPYANGKQTKGEMRQAWIDGGRVGDDPWPRVRTAAQREVRNRLQALDKQLKRGRYAPKPITAAELGEKAALRTAERMARIAGLADAKMARIHRGPSQRDQAEAWVMAGRPEDSVPPHVTAARKRVAKWKREQAERKALERSVGLRPAAVRGNGGRPRRANSARAQRTAALVGLMGQTPGERK